MPKLKTRPGDFAKLWGYSVGFYGVWIAHVGRQAGLLEILAANPMSIEELVSTSKMHPPAVKAWCSAAVSYGLVKQKKGKMSLKSGMRSLLLDRRNPNYLGGQLSYLALRSLEYGGFKDFFKSGKTRVMSATIDAIEQATDWDHYTFLDAVRHDKKLHALMSSACRFLDVGCGTGSMLAKIHKEYPRVALVGVDPSEKSVAKARKISKSIKIIKIAGESMDFRNEFDVAYLGESLYAAHDKKKVMSNCLRALKMGGTVAIIEGLIPDKVEDNENRLIMGMQLDFALHGDRFMTRSEVTCLLREFSKIRFRNLGGSVYLVTATK